MATKKKKKAKSAPKARPRQARGRGRRVILLLVTAVAIIGGGAGLYVANRPVPEVPVPVSVVQAAGVHGPGAGGLDSPRGLAVAPDGDVYVADLSNARVAVFGPDGAFKFNFGKLGPEPGKGKPGEFNEPSGVAVAPDGSVYVADAWNGRVQKFDAQGHSLGEYGGARYSFYSPRNVAVDRAGNLYVADTGNSAVKVIDPTGKLLKVLGGPGSGKGQCNEVFGVAVDSRGDIFVADHGNKRIHKFGPLPAGEFIKDRKVPGWQLADPFWPHLAVDARDNVYAVDSGNRKIWIFDNDLKYRGTIGGDQPGNPFAAPLGLAFDSAGSLWVSDMANNKLLKLGPFTVPAVK